METVYCAVRTEPYVTQKRLALKGLMSLNQLNGSGLVRSFKTSEQNLCRLCPCDPKLPVFVGNAQTSVASNMVEGYSINSLQKPKMAAQPTYT